MHQLIFVFIINFSIVTFGQSEMDTIIINDYQKFAFIHGPGKGKNPDTLYYEIANDSIYYNGKGYFKTCQSYS